VALNPPAGWAPPVLLILGGILDLIGALGLVISGGGWGLLLILGGLMSATGAVILLRRTRATRARS
jgi:hypothetical protein